MKEGELSNAREKLKGCPHCGDKPIFWESDIDDNGDALFHVDCCAEMTSSFYGCHEPTKRGTSLANLIYEWNSRANVENIDKEHLNRTYQSGIGAGVTKCKNHLLNLAMEAFKNKQDEQANLLRKVAEEL